MKPTRIKPSAKPLGKRMIDGLQDLVDAIQSGVPLEKKFTVRTVSIPEPTTYNAKAIRKLRMKLGLSQSVFAMMTGVSKKLVEHWECGIRKPSRMACRLFDAITANPEHFLPKSQPRSAA